MSLQGTLALLITALVFAIGSLFTFKPPDPANQILTGLISTVMTVFVMVFSYYFGSSSGSKDKDDTVKQIALASSPVVEDKPVAPPVPTPTKLTSVAPVQQSAG